MSNKHGILTKKITDSFSFAEPSVMPKKKFALKEYEVILPEEFAPRFSLLLRNRYIQDGHSVKLTCTADGNPNPTLTWFKVATYEFSNYVGLHYLFFNVSACSTLGWTPD